jgi:4-amino-4-deoxy-L-arabinose transferase-like glycosyltransferase
MPMYSTVERIALYALLLVPPLLLCVAWFWSFRAGRRLRPSRRVPFLCGLTATTIAYLAQFIAFHYSPDASLLRVVQLMLISAVAAFMTSWLGRGYGRISGCTASVLVFATWLLKGSP